MKPLTIEWVSKAEGDFDAALLLRRSRKRNRYDSICFHAQQCAEKYLKARLQEASIPFTRTHDLAELLKLLSAVEPLWSPLAPALTDLSKAAVEFRYPGNAALPDTARESFKTCNTVRRLVRQRLGLKP